MSDDANHADASLSVSQEPSYRSQMRTGHQYSATILDGNSSAHFGDVYYQYQGVPHTPFRPSLLIPFRRDRDFVERDALDDICRLTSLPAARVALVGLGGVGKTQIAIEYAYRRREADPQLWVFWVHASSGARFEDSYRQIAQQVHIDSWADPETNVLSAVHVWLSDETNGRWAMVVDNADNDEIMFGSANGEARTSSDRALSDYLPSSVNGSIVITSRSRKVAEGLIEYAEDILEVGPMAQEDAMALLSKKLKKPQQDADSDQLAQLVEELDLMPLAITQAAAYINQLGSRMTVSQYLDRLARSNLDREALLQKDIRDPRRDGQASNSIIVTWHTSFEHIRQVQTSAARLLALMSLFDREGIPEALLQDQYLQNEKSASSEGEPNVTRCEHDFNEDIALLQMYSLIKSGMSDQLFDMHRLVQFSTRKWLDLHGELAYWQEKYVGILHAEIPGTYDDPSYWPLYQAFFPHVEAVMLYVVASEEYVLKRATVLYLGAGYADWKGQYEIAFQMLQTSLQDRERLLGPDDVDTLDCLYVLGVVLFHQGKYELAQDTQRRALAGYEKQPGKYRTDILISVVEVARAQRSQGKYGEAEQLCRRALVRLEMELGPDCNETLIAMQELAMNLRYQGKFNEAEQMSRSVLTNSEEQLGPSHNRTLAAMGNLGSMLLSQRKYEEAEQIIRQSLESCEKHFGPNHPGTLNNVYNLAALSFNRGDYQQSLRLFDRAVEGYIRTLGPSHPYTLNSQEWRRQALEQINSPPHTTATPST